MGLSAESQSKISSFSFKVAHFLDVLALVSSESPVKKKPFERACSFALYTTFALHISENSGKLYVADLANDVHCNFPPEALMNIVSSYEAVYWLERISYDFLI